MDRDSGRGPGLRRMLRRGKMTVVPTVRMVRPRLVLRSFSEVGQAREKRVTILSAAPAPERSTVRGRLRKRAQIKSPKSPEMRHFRVRQSPATSPSPGSSRSRSIRIAVARPRSRSQENHSAKSVRTGFPSSPSSSPERGDCSPRARKMKNGGASPAAVELSFSLTIHRTMHPMVHTSRRVSHTPRPRASAERFGTS